MIIKLAWASLRRNPVRAALTASAMIAAAAIVAWMVAGYDAILSEAAADPEAVIGRYDLLVAARGRLNPALPAEIVRRLDAAPSVRETALFAAFDVNVQAAGQGSGEKPSGVPGMGRRQERQEPRGPTGGDNATPAVAPPTYGLPTRGATVVGTTAKMPPRAMQSGHWLDEQTARPADPHSPLPCVIGEALAKRLGLHDGEPLWVGSQAGTFALVVQGVMEDCPSPHKLQTLATAGEQLGLPRPDSIHVAWTNAERIAGGALKANHILLQLIDEKSNSQVFFDTWSAQLAAAQARLINDDDIARALRSSDSNAHLRLQAYSATGMSMLVSFFIIFSSLSMGVEERVRQFAILRAVALTHSQLALMLVIEGLFYGLIGWLGGLVSGRLLLACMPSLAGTPARPMAAGDWRIGFWTIVLTGLCALAGSLAASLYPAWQAMRVRPLDAMNPTAAPLRHHCPLLLLPGLLLLAVNPVLVFVPDLPEDLRIKLYGFVGCPAMTLAFVLLAPACYRLCQLLFCAPMARALWLQPPFLASQLRANLWRGAGTVMALSVGLGLYMTAIIWSASMLKPFLPGEWLPEMFASIIPGGLHDDDLPAVRAIAGIDGERCLPVAVEQAKLLKDLTGSQRRQNVVRQDNVVFFGLDSAQAYAGPQPLLPFRFARGSNRDKALAALAAGNNACLIPSHFAQLAGLEVGDLFTVIPPDAPNTTVDYRVAGIINLNGWHWFSKFSGTRRQSARTAAMIFADIRSVRRDFQLSRVNYLWFACQAGADQSDIAAALQDLARRNAGQLYHIPGRGDVPIQREFVKLTATDELRQSILARTETIVAGMLRLPMLILLVTALAVANTAAAALRSRRWEMGVMRAVGLSSGAMARLILGEAWMIGLTAAVLSVSFGLFSGLCSAQMATHVSYFGGMGWNFAVPWLMLVKGLAITLGLCCVAALIPALCAMRSWPLALLQDGPKE